MLATYQKVKEVGDIPFAKRKKFIDNEDATLGVYENVAVVSSDTSAVTVTLPEVGEAEGQMFDVTALDGATNAVTVNDAAGDNVTTSTISAAGGFVTVISTGRNWRVLAESLA